MPPRSLNYVGFGFGPIQSALFLFEAYRSGNFGRFTVAEVDANLVQAVRENGGAYTVNIAHPDRIERFTVPGVELLNPAVAADRAKLVDAISQADEMTTALPSVKFFASGGPSSVVSLLREGLAARKGGRPAILYAAENHNHAAEILTEALATATPTPTLANFQALNTVVGKMSGVITDAPTIQRLNLATLTPSGAGANRAVLVEAFNRILISRVTLSGESGGSGGTGVKHAIPVFVEKDDLLPFEEAKLYGHNAIHALIGYLSHFRTPGGLTTMAEAADHPDIMAAARAAFLDESGTALIRKHARLGDPLFTPAGYRAYAEDLLVRMVNPNLNDLVARVIRDPARKLAYDDRLFGTMRLALEQGISPVHMAQGAAAAVRYLVESDTRSPVRSQADLAALLRGLWGEKCDGYADQLIGLTWQAMAESRVRGAGSAA